MKRATTACLVLSMLALPLSAQGPANLTDVTVLPEGTGAPPVIPDGLSLPGFIFFMVRGEFEAAVPGLPCEDFEEARVPPGGVIGAPAPLDASTNNALFLPGEILPGVSFQDDPLNGDGGGSPDGLALLGSGFAGTLSKVVVANTFVDSFEIRFSPAVTAAGFDVVNLINVDTVNVEFFDAGGSALGSQLYGGDPAGIFLGFVSASPVGRIRLTAMESVGTGAEGVDNVCFGQAYQAPLIQAIPALDAMGIAALVVALGLGAILFLRRRRIA